MEPLAKPTGITLADHTRHVGDEMQLLLAAYPYPVRKYAALTGRDLLTLGPKAAFWHDAGKQDDWQKYCRLDHAEWLRLGRPHQFRGKHLQKSGIRHELDSLLRLFQPQNPDRELPFCAYVAIAAHHGKLGRKHEHRWQMHDKHKWFWEKFEQKGNALVSDDPASFDPAIRLRYEYDGPRALLQFADHRASAKEEKVVVPELLKFKYQFPYDKKRGVQLLITELWDEPFTILRAPTGAGKTDASLLWAQRQIAQDRADRLVIAMPTRFTANSLAIATTEALGSTGLYHSSAWYKAKNAPTDPEKAGWKAELAYARQLETPVTVTTIDHLCLCLTGAREDHHAIFWNLAHSCVVVDEADFYDVFTQRNLVVLLRALRLLQVPVLLMSATVPESARQFYNQEAGMAASRIWEDEKAEELTRLRCQLLRAGQCGAATDEGKLPDKIDAVLRRGLAGEPLIIYANTVRRAQAYYDWLRKADSEFEDVVLYHSRFTEEHKFSIEERLKELLGKDAWKNGTQRGIAILTQIGELSVNISADLMLSDLCPVDRLAQRVGRLARFDERAGRKKNDWATGELHIVEPLALNKKTNALAPYPAPYGHYDKEEGWQPSQVLTDSGKWLVEDVYSAQRFMQLVNDLYPKVASPEADAAANALKLQRMVVRDWLIVPCHEIAPEDDDTPEWKSRDIDAQKTVLVEVDTSGFDMNTLDFSNFLAFREWSLPKSITVPAYEYARAMRQGMLESTKAYIGYDQKEEQLMVVKPRYYSAERGLAFEERNDFNEFEGS
jgi:CRISPR-associated endonuclease/helicase Cas3